MIQAKSIKGRLLLGIFLSSTTLLFIFGFSLHYKFREIIFNSVDRALHSKLQLVKGLMHEDGNDIEFEVDEIVFGEYVIPRSGHYYQILVDGSIASASPSLVGETFNLTSDSLVSFNENTGEWIYDSIGPADEPIRIMRHDFEFHGKSISVRVGENIAESLAIMGKITNYFFIILPFMILLVGLVSFMVASLSLAPLKIFSASIEKISHKNLNKRIEGGNQVRELQGLAEAFNSLFERLQVAFESEKKLIADAAHELKTPLAVIKAQCNISLLKERTHEEYIDSLVEITAVSEAMQLQINNMLTLARLDSGILSSVDFYDVDLQTCIEDALRLIELLAQDKKLHISKKFHPGIIVRGDKGALTEAISNILDNAVRYNVQGGFVAVELSCDNNRAILTISDSGIGIKKEEIARIFDRFYRSETFRDTEGTGLGLSIALAVIKAHGGDITVRSEISVGSSFIVSLPMESVPC